MPSFALVALGHRVELLGRRLCGSILLERALLQPTTSLPQIVQTVCDLVQLLVKRVLPAFLVSTPGMGVLAIGGEPLSSQLHLLGLSPREHRPIQETAYDPICDGTHGRRPMRAIKPKVEVGSLRNFLLQAFGHPKLVTLIARDQNPVAHHLPI